MVDPVEVAGQRPVDHRPSLVGRAGEVRAPPSAQQQLELGPPRQRRRAGPADRSGRSRRRRRPRPPESGWPRPRPAGRSPAAAGRRSPSGRSSSRRPGTGALGPAPAHRSARGLRRRRSGRRRRRSGRGPAGRRPTWRTAPRRRTGSCCRTVRPRRLRTARAGPPRPGCPSRPGRAGRPGRSAAAGPGRRWAGWRRSAARPTGGSGCRTGPPATAARHRPGQLGGEGLRVLVQPQHGGRRQLAGQQHLVLAGAGLDQLGQQPVDVGVPAGDQVLAVEQQQVGRGVVVRPGLDVALPRPLRPRAPPRGAGPARPGRAASATAAARPTPPAGCTGPAGCASATS